MDIEKAPQEILRLANQDNPSMSETEFVTKWIKTLHEYMSGGHVEIGIWLSRNEITVFREVSIKDNKGEVLYNVPSILVQQDRILPQKVSSGIADLLYRVDNMNRVIPGRGNAFIRSEITNQVIQTDTKLNHQQRWDAIFTRYGLDSVFGYTDAQIVSASDDDEGFDDYEEL